MRGANYNTPEAFTSKKKWRPEKENQFLTKHKTLLAWAVSQFPVPESRLLSPGIREVAATAGAPE